MHNDDNFVHYDINAKHLTDTEKVIKIPIRI